jgi:hypothetical protein
MPVRKATDLLPAFRPSTTQPSAPTPTTPVSQPVAAPTGFTATAPSAVQAKVNELRALMAGHTDRGEEGRILAMFKGASFGELNQLLAALPKEELHELVEDMDDRLIGPDNRTAFLELISHGRVGDLTIENRVKVVQALQLGSTGSLEEKAVVAVFLATKGESLTALKNGIDGATDYHDLQELVFHDLDSSALRGQLLAHFKAEAPPKSTRVKVLSDIDDTFYVNLKDDRFPKKTVYPGVKALYAELDKGAGAQADRTGDLMFLSARPYDRAGVSEHFTRQMMFDHGVTQATVLSGDFAHLIGNQSIADKKFDNWQQVNQLYPEYGSVFLGDSGQGDALFGAKAAATSGGDMRSVFIHNVTHLDAAARADFAKKGVFIFDTYVGAAAEAFKRGLISKSGLERVMSDAGREFDAIAFSSPGQKVERRAELDRDLATARAALH